MCVNFLPVTPATLQGHFQVPSPDPAWQEEAWQDYLAPIVVGDGGQRQCVLASYGMVPRRRIPEGVRKYSTMNARSETLGERRAYRSAWRVGQYCLVPMYGFFEPCYVSGKAERWRIGLQDDAPFAVAGLWRSWDEPDGSLSYSFTQLTINADQHPLMRRFHKPDDEKRSLVIVPEQDYDTWLGCRNAELARAFLTPFPAERMQARPQPLPARKPRA
ncbi:SOS response-associated peptidase [Chitiniphilus purpureus]|uniref:Abasic site processing protein n=1 Tax=Chitiniphilus purpureus TaxID=2981137 RepID=A0ABY6DKG6_9NEIS|nr:SOS response-associated peptidase [Chitiniphilus sp. CD1]UXY14857.1 SOS response-associated peptidase [Chitiniphilus sp. CD1]